MGVHLPRDVHTSEVTRQQFDEWLAEKLELVWKERGEVEFVDFLFNEKGESSSIEGKENEDPTEITIGTDAGIRFEENSNSILRGISI